MVWTSRRDFSRITNKLFLSNLMVKIWMGIPICNLPITTVTGSKPIARRRQQLRRRGEKIKFSLDHIFNFLIKKTKILVFLWLYLIVRGSRWWYLTFGISRFESFSKVWRNFFRFFFLKVYDFYWLLAMHHHLISIVRPLMIL